LLFVRDLSTADIASAALRDLRRYAFYFTILPALRYGEYGGTLVTFIACVPSQH